MPAAALATDLADRSLETDCAQAAIASSASATRSPSSTHAAMQPCRVVTSGASWLLDVPHAGVAPINKGANSEGRFDIAARDAKRGGLVRWISNSNGNWHVAANWLDGAVPFDGDSIGFGVGEGDLQIETADTNNAGNGVTLPNSILQIERKMIFSDASAGGDPALADDGMSFDTIQANGVGGVPVVFNVPVAAVTLSSNRHGAVFNREITAAQILALSQHQDRWQINASATAPIGLLRINENRGPDGDSVDGSFAINSNLSIDRLEHVWGRLIVGSDAVVSVERYFYLSYVNAAQNNNINPITLDGVLTVETFTVSDNALLTADDLDLGTYGRVGNASADFEVDFIAGDGLLTVIGGPQVFFDGFESD
jgi:hypothetical protein